MLQRIANACTGPRVALLAMLAVINMLVLILAAEVPMVSALQVAVAQQKGKSPPDAPGNCPALLRNVSGELAAFDGRKGGYTVDEARTVLCAMAANNGEARSLYLTRHFPIDMVFPLLYGPALAALYLYLVRSLGVRSGPVYSLAIAPVAGAALDIAENLEVRELVVAGPGASESLIGLASLLTTTKYGFVLASLVVTLVLLVRHLVVESFRRTDQR